MKKINNNTDRKNKKSSKSRSKSKNKSKSKDKKKKFNPLQYLHSIIEEMHQNSYETTKKRSINTKRDLSNALTLATPILQKTISTTQVRCKSSYSQCRKKSSGMRDILNINFEKLITEEDTIIQFSQITNQSEIKTKKFSESDLQHRKSQNSNYILRVRENAARKIQKAWRNFQTLKMVTKYFMYYQRLMEKEKADKRKKEQEIRSSFEEKSKQHNFKKASENLSGSKSMRARQQHKRTLKIRKESPSEELKNRFIEKTVSKLRQNVQKQSQSPSYSSKNKDMHQVSLNQTNELMNTMNLNQNQQINSKDLKFVIDLFKSNQKIAEEQISHKINEIQNQQRVSNKIYQKSDQFSDNIHLQEESQFGSKELISNLSPEKQKSIQFSNSEDKSIIIFETRQRVIQNKYESMIDRLNQIISKQEINEQQGKERKQQIRGRYEKQKRSNSQCKAEYEKILWKVRNNALQLQKDWIHIERINSHNLSSKSLRKQKGSIRRCFSEKCFLIKCILEQANLINIEMKDEDLSDIVSVSQKDESCLQVNKKMLQIEIKSHYQKIHEANVLMSQFQAPSSPISSNSDGENLLDSDRSLQCHDDFDSEAKLKHQIYKREYQQDYSSSSKQHQYQDISQEFHQIEEPSNFSINQHENNEFQAQSYDLIIQQTENIRNIRMFSEQIEQIIEKILFQEFSQQIFLNDDLYKQFRPYVQDIYEFKAISDQQILTFIDKEIVRFFEPENVMIKKVNQKINPSSIEILRLIRDFQFQIEEYELIIPEEVFKCYRKNLEEEYQIKIKTVRQKQIINLQNYSETLRTKIQEKEEDRKTKHIKYISFERDLKIMYMKSVFNCLNQLLIQCKSINSYMNSRSSIGPGQLKLAIKEYNCECDRSKMQELIHLSKSKIKAIISKKCMIPSFKNYKDLELFQRQIGRQLQDELQQNEFKWVNYMDEVLQVWQDLSMDIIQNLIFQAVRDIRTIKSQ